MKGRHPKSIEKHKKDGTIHTRHQKSPLLIGGRKKPKCPKELDGYTRKAFKFLVEELWAAEILDYADTPVVIAAAVHWGRAMDAAKIIKEEGLIISVDRGAYGGKEGYSTDEPNPAVRIEREAWAQFRQYADLLGIGPSARARLGSFGVKGRAPSKEIPGMGSARQLRVVGDE